MIRVFWFFLLCLIVAGGAAYLLTLEGTARIELGGYVLEPAIGLLVMALIGLVLVCVFAWGFLRSVVDLPFIFSRKSAMRKKERGIKALSDGFIAIYSGDAKTARGLARAAGNLLPNNAAAQLLEARASVMLGNTLEAREHYKALIENPATSIAALTGLYDEARAQGQDDAALTFAQRASSLQPKLAWAARAVFDDLCAQSDWQGAIDYLSSRAGLQIFDKDARTRTRGVLLTAKALSLETSKPIDALEEARAALKIIPNFVPAALVAARIHINGGEVRKASSLLSKTWAHEHHGDIAALYMHAEQGAAVTERLKRARKLIKLPVVDVAAALAFARVAVDAQEWDLARTALANFVDEDAKTGAPTSGLCTLMAEIEQGEGDQGRTRFWLARAVNAPADPCWMADGVAQVEWAARAPKSGKLDKFVWQAPQNLRGDLPEISGAANKWDARETDDDVLMLESEITTDGDVPDDGSAQNSEADKPEVAKDDAAK